MIELETFHLPELTDYMQFWKGYVDGTICFIKVGSVNYILSVLNSFVVNVNVKFAYELEHEGITILRCTFVKNGKEDLHNSLLESYQQLCIFELECICTN